MVAIENPPDRALALVQRSRSLRNPPRYTGARTLGQMACQTLASQSGIWIFPLRKIKMNQQSAHVRVRTSELPPRAHNALTLIGILVGEFPASLRKLPQTPFFKRDGPKLRVLLRVVSGWPTIRPELRLKLRELGAILQCMAAARSLAAVLLVVLASTLTAQNTSTGQVVVSVIDQSGAVIPGAHIGIIRLPSVVPNDGDWLHYALHASEQASAHTDAYGGATVGLAKGIYAITIAANGFQRHLERIEIRDEPSQALRATLLAGGCTNCVEVTPGITIPLEYASSLNIFIPLEPLQTITVTNAQVRRRWLRF